MVFGVQDVVLCFVDIHHVHPMGRAVAIQAERIPAPLPPRILPAVSEISEEVRVDPKIMAPPSLFPASQ